MVEINKNLLNSEAENIIEPKIKTLSLPKLNYYNYITKELEINNINYKNKKHLNKKELYGNVDLFTNIYITKIKDFKIIYQKIISI